MKNQTKKNRSFNNHKRVRININLNQVNQVCGKHFEVSNDEFTKNWLEQLKEMYAHQSSITNVSGKENKLIVKWWEN